MVRLAANLTQMFNELPFIERFAAAAEAGFEAVECLLPYEASAEAIADQLRRHGLRIVLFNSPSGNWNGGDRGFAATPERVEEFRSDMQTALHYARVTQCPRVHVMPGKVPESADVAAYERTFLQNVQYAADLVAGNNVDIMLEPINTRVDIPGYFYSSTAKAVEILEKVDRRNVKLQYDIYHMQIMEGDLARRIEKLLPLIGHIQLADNPGRGEPGTGEVNYTWLLERIDALGYGGWIGCEYRPAAGTWAGLGWAERYLNKGVRKGGKPS